VRDLVADVPPQRVRGVPDACSIAIPALTLGLNARIRSAPR
jgi:hypothetical protein